MRHGQIPVIKSLVVKAASPPSLAENFSFSPNPLDHLPYLLLHSDIRIKDLIYISCFSCIDFLAYCLTFADVDMLSQQQKQIIENCENCARSPMFLPLCHGNHSNRLLTPLS